MAKFRTIYAGRYINDETGVEIVKVPARRLGRNGHRVAGWVVTAPTRGVPDEIAFGVTKGSVMADAKERAEMVRETIAEACVEAVAEHVERAARKAEAAGAPTWRVDSARRMLDYGKTGLASWLAGVINEVRRIEAQTTEHVPATEDATIAKAYDEAVVEDASRTAKASDEWASFDQLRNWVARHGLLSGRPGHVNPAIEADHAEALAVDRAYPSGQSRNWREHVYRRAVDMDAAAPHMGHAYDSLIDEACAEALTEDEERRIAATIDAHELADVQDAARTIESARTEDRAARNEAHRENAARIIAAARAPEGERCGCHTPARLVASHGLPEVPDSLNDEAGWDAYCAALPAPTDQEIADVLAEYGDPYAAPRAAVVGNFKDAARMIWKMREAQRIAGATLDQAMLDHLRKSMRTLRGVLKVYDDLTESWRIGNRTDANRDAATRTF